jgi:oligoribonuclease NrnB/cAMP/cGMP phosphodiesterase (DHH superfamily)
MDGLASAYVATKYFDKIEQDYICLPIQYGEDIYEVLSSCISTSNYLYFLDFSTDRNILLDLSKMYKTITILDHHKTAQENLKDIDTIENITCVFDMNRSGAMITYDYFFPIRNKEHESLRYVISYVQDRDLWNWKLPYSKEISEFLNFKTDGTINSFRNIVEDFDVDNAIMIGSTLLNVKTKAVNKKVKNFRCINIDGIEIVALNATENISEIGNTLCINESKVSMMYFITEDLSVVLSFRSLDILPDASVLAKKFGGGGHRNACGATISIDELKYLLN